MDNHLPRHYLIWAVILLLVVPFAGCKGSGGGGDIITIGVVLPITGREGKPGQYQREGIELAIKQKPIEGVSTSTTGMVGVTTKGPTEGAPVLVTSFAEFRERFGSYLAEPTDVDGATRRDAGAGRHDHRRSRQGDRVADSVSTRHPPGSAPPGPAATATR